MTNKTTSYYFLKINQSKYYNNINLNIVPLNWVKKTKNYKKVVKQNKKEDKKSNVGLIMLLSQPQEFYKEKIKK
jgi:hypothetical protein